MKIIIEAEPKEIADLVNKVQSQPSYKKIVDEISNSKLPAEMKKSLGEAATNLELCTTDVLILVSEILNNLHLL